MTPYMFMHIRHGLRHLHTEMTKAVPGLLKDLASRHETEGELLTLTLTGFSEIKGRREEKRYKEAETLREREQEEMERRRERRQRLAVRNSGAPP